MDNMQRLELEVGIEYIQTMEYEVYLEEAGLNPFNEYDPKSKTNLKKIYVATLAILESIANDINKMKNYKTEDMSITHFHTNLMNRIDDLRRKINTMANDEMVSDNDARIVPFIW